MWSGFSFKWYGSLAANNDILSAALNTLIVAVVSTAIGAEGLPVTPGGDVVIADGVDGFAEAVVALLRDPARRVQLERAARRLVVERYDWSAVAGQLEEALTKAASLTRRAAA